MRTCAKDTGILGREPQLPVPKFQRSLSSVLTPHALLAGAAPSYLRVPPSPSSLPCSTQRSAAATWRGTLWLGELGPRRVQGSVWVTSVCALEWARRPGLQKETNGHVLVWVCLGDKWRIRCLF